MNRTATALITFALAATLAAGCTSEPEISDGLPLADEAGAPADDPIPVEPDGGIGDQPIPVEPDGGAGDQPMPVEPDGGIGGPGDPIVQSNLILDGDRTEVLATCLEPDAGAATVYRMDLDGGAALWLYRTDEGDRFELAGADGTTSVSAEDQPPTISESEGAISAQGLVIAEDGSERFVDATFGTTELPAC